MESYAEAIGVRIASLIAILAFVYYAPTSLFFVIAVAIGLGHFGLAFMYQAEGGHLSRGKLLLLGAIALLLGALVYFGWVALLGFVNGVGFLVHFSLDEVRLLRGTHSFYTLLEALPAITLVTGIFAESYLTVDWFMPAVSIAIGSLLLYAVLAIWNRRAPDAVSCAFYCYAALSFIAYDFVRFAPERAFEVFWIVALLHFAIWYGFYWYKLKHSPQARTTYFTRTLLINIVLFVLAGLYLAHPSIPTLGILFSITLFFVLSLLHGLASMRPQELRASLHVTS